jgi:hypothetical protein
MARRWAASSDLRTEIVLDALMSTAPYADRVFVQATCILAFCDHAQIAN